MAACWTIRQEGAHHAVALGSCSLFRHNVVVQPAQPGSLMCTYTRIPDLHACSWAQKTCSVGNWMLCAQALCALIPPWVAWMYPDQ